MSVPPSFFSGICTFLGSRHSITMLGMQHMHSLECCNSGLSIDYNFDRRGNAIEIWWWDKMSINSFISLVVKVYPSLQSQFVCNNCTNILTLYVFSEHYFDVTISCLWYKMYNILYYLSCIWGYFCLFGLYTRLRVFLVSAYTVNHCHL